MTFRIFLTLMVGSGLVAGCVSFSKTGTLALAAPASAAPAANAPSPAKVHLVSARVITPRFGRSTGELPSIEVRVTNRGTEPFVFRTENIEAIADSIPVKVYNFSEFMVLVDRNAQVEYGAAEARERAAIQKNPWTLMSTMPSTTVSAKLDAMTEREDIKSKRQKLLESTLAMLHQETVVPGQTFGGVVRLKAAPLLSAHELRLRVQVGSETHEIRFVLNGDTGKQ